MSEIMRPMSIGHLMHWIMSEYEQKKSIFGIEKIVKHENGQALPIYEEKIEFSVWSGSRPEQPAGTEYRSSLCGWLPFLRVKDRSGDGWR